MSGLHEVDCSGCGRRHVTSGEQARRQRVLRCDCGHFLRLDWALAEGRSEPVPPPPAKLSANEDGQDGEGDDDATHMLSSLAAVAAISGGGRARAPQPSLSDDERTSRPVQRASTLRSLPPAPARQPSIAPSDKPLWYVDLGGTELVEMTIEQLILARRSGKLGEGALVWREGMPSWRPVGTLIPAASASSHPSPLSTPSASPAPSRSPLAAAIRTPMPGRPPAPKRTPPPSPPAEEATPQSLASYERPLATLEFALERPEPPPPRSPLPSIHSSASQLSRPPTPLPRASLSAAFNTPFPRPAPLPQVASPATPSPPLRHSPPPAPGASPSPPPATLAARASDHPSQQTFAGLQTAHLPSERPRWVSACIALVVCITASAAGASLVRSLRQPQKPQTHLASPALTPVVHASTATQPSVTPAPPAGSAPLVVDLESLSVERKPTPPRTPRATPKPAAEPDTSDEATQPANESTAEPAATEPPKSTDAPAADRPNPYGSGSLIDQIKRATADEDAAK